MTTVNMPDRMEEDRSEPLIGPIDPERVVLVRMAGMPIGRSQRMGLNELIAYILGQDPTDDPVGINETLAHLACGLNNRLGDAQRQRLRPLAWELAGTFCWRCTFTRIDLLTAMTAREMVSRVWMRDGLRRDARQLATWRGDITEATPLMNAVLKRVPQAERATSAPAICARRMLDILRETARRPSLRTIPGQYPDEEHHLADANFGIALVARGVMSEGEWADLLMGQLRNLVDICPHVDRSARPRDRRYHPWWR